MQTSLPPDFQPPPLRNRGPSAVHEAAVSAFKDFVGPRYCDLAVEAGLRRVTNDVSIKIGNDKLIQPDGLICMNVGMQMLVLTAVEVLHTQSWSNLCAKVCGPSFSIQICLTEWMQYANLHRHGGLPKLGVFLVAAKEVNPGAYLQAIEDQELLHWAETVLPNAEGYRWDWGLWC